MSERIGKYGGNRPQRKERRVWPGLSGRFAATSGSGDYSYLHRSDEPFYNARSQGAYHDHYDCDDRHPTRPHHHHRPRPFAGQELDSESDEKHSRGSSQRQRKTSSRARRNPLISLAWMLMFCAAILCIFYVYRLSPPFLSSILVPNHPDQSQVDAKSPIASHDAMNTSKPDVRPYLPPNSPSIRYSTELEARTGHWEPIAPVPVAPELLAIEDKYPNPYRVSWHWCAPMPDIRAAGGGRWDNGHWDDGEWTEEEIISEGEKRSVELYAWEWVPDVGVLKEFNAIDFVIRLLKSPGGLILVGDSLTRQHYHTICRLVAKAGIEYDQDLPSLPMHDHKNVQQHTLKPGHPMTERLLSLAKVPRSRLERPFITMLEDHLLIGQTDIREITYKYGAEEGYKWWWDFQRVPGWEEFVAKASAPRLGEVDTVIEDTILLLNAGAHWARHEFGMLPTNKLQEEQARLRATYSGMVDKITERLSPIPQLSAYYRSTSPGHPGCRNRREPYLDQETALFHELNVRERLLKDALTDRERSGREVWDWDQFEEHNSIWKRKIRSGLERSERALRNNEDLVKMREWAN